MGKVKHLIKMLLDCGCFYWIVDFTYPFLKSKYVMNKEMMLERFIKLIAKARKTPNERAHSFEVIRNMVGTLATKLIEQETKVREEIGAAANETFRVPPEEETEE